MRDPHVQSLSYRLVTGPELRFVSPSLSWSTEAFDLQLDETGSTVVTVKRHFSDVESARETVESRLRDWEVSAMLRRGRKIRFEFVDAEVIDRDPPPPGGVVVVPLTGRMTMTGHLASVVVTDQYPPPPDGFSLSPLAETLWVRFEGYLAGREPLASMAYFCCTVLESSAGGRTQAAKTFQVGEDILSKLGELTSTRGSLYEARKAKGSFQPFAETEKSWIEEAIRQIIFRLGEISSAPQTSRKRLRMEDLPPL